MHIVLGSPCHEDILTTTATSIAQLNTTTTIDIHESAFLYEFPVKNNVGAHDAAATSMVRIDLDEKTIAWCVTVLLLFDDDKSILSRQKQPTS